MERSTAEEIAGRFISLIESATRRLQVAGSIRREVEHVKDIELVAMPRYLTAQPDLFGGEGAVTRNLLDERCDELLHDGAVSQRLDKNGRPRWGSGYHALTFDGEAIDLFGVLSPERWGSILAIRTGPGDFNRIVVTSRFDGGAMPSGMRQMGGALTRGGTLISTPEEEDWFREIGIPCWPPAARSAERLRTYLRERRAS